MTDRAAIAQIVQIFPEVTKGTAAAATKRLSALSIRPRPRAEVDAFGPAGEEFDTLTALNREWTEAPAEGRLTYTEGIVPLSSVVGTPTITTPAGATLARQHEFDHAAVTESQYQTFTVEHGSAERGARASHMAMVDFGLEWSRTGSGVPISGLFLGKQYTDGFTMTTSGITTYPLVPVLPGQISVYADDTAAGLGTTKLLRAFGGSFALNGRRGAFFALNDAEPSFSGLSRRKPDPSFSLRVGADEVGMPLAMLYRTGASKFVRIEAKGAEIDTGVATSRYRFTLDVCVQVVDPGEFDEEEGLMVIPPTFRVIKDGTWGRAFRIQVVNNLTAL